MKDDYIVLKEKNTYLERVFKIKYDVEKKEYRLKNSDFSFFNGDFNKAKELGGVYIEEIKKVAIKNSDFLFFSNVNSEEKNKVTELGAFYIGDPVKKYVIKYSILNKYNILNWYKNPAEDINVNTNNASIFIGRRIETDLLRSLSKVKKRIYIISPYISDENINLCSEILNDSNKNIDFKIITSLDIENPKNYIKSALKKLITVELDKSKEDEIQKIKNEIDIKNRIIAKKTNKSIYQSEFNFFFTFIISILILLLFFNSKLLIIFSIFFSLFYFFNRENKIKKEFNNRTNIEYEIKNLQEKLFRYF